jgi:hypothetical protein
VREAKFISMKIACGFLMVAVVFWVTLVGGQETPKEHHAKSQQFMRQKLTFSQGVLEGLVLEKFELISSNAILLRNMNLTNAYFMLGNQDYSRNIRNFQLKVDRLSRAARERNLKDASTAYSQVAESCVTCHKSFRREQAVQRQLGHQ